MNDLGELSLWIALLMAAWGAALSLAGGASGRDAFVASGRRGIHAAAAFTALASAVLAWALVTNDFSLRYVATFSASNLPERFRLSAFWVGRAGSMLTWDLALATCATIVLATNRRRNRELMPWLAGAISGVLALFLADSALRLDPFERLRVPSDDGRGLDPLLQGWAAATEPALLYAGYMAALVALGVAGTALVRRRLDAEAATTTREWSALAWSLLLGGALVGIRKSYLATGAVGPVEWQSLTLVGAGSGFTVPGALLAAGATLVAGALLAAARARVSGEGTLWRERSWRARAGRAMLAAGCVLCVAGVVSATRTKSVAMELGDGETFTIRDPFGRDWTFTSQGASRIQRVNHFAAAVALIPIRSGRRLPFVTSERREYVDAEERDQFPVLTTPGILGGLLEDVSIVLNGANGGRSEFRVAFIPLAAWVWIGGVLVLGGGACVLWPSPRRNQVT